MSVLVPALPELARVGEHLLTRVSMAGREGSEILTLLMILFIFSALLSITFLTPNTWSLGILVPETIVDIILF